MDNREIEKINSFIEKLPKPERERPILVVEGKLLTWNDILEEFKRDSKLKNSILEKIKERIK